MSYMIALASSDGTNVDWHFGGAESFDIYVVEDGEYSFFEKRVAVVDNNDAQVTQVSANNAGCHGDGNGCASGGGCGQGGGCGGDVLTKVELISDCRCVVCRKIGFNIQKQLERRAITFFDVSCTVEEALKKISTYFDRVDKHQSLRGISGK